ncbi:MAG: KUP/HAK/KT family potassium transporter [Caldilineaceae bacterium]
MAGFLVLGSVFLVVTGGEALYADMGHFGKRPIRVAWFMIVLPALLLNYFGQGALLLQYPEAVENPFYRMAPTWALYPVVLIATTATVIASQALITGAFSLARQAVQLGYLPRMAINHTSEERSVRSTFPASIGCSWWHVLPLSLPLAPRQPGRSLRGCRHHDNGDYGTHPLCGRREHWRWSRPKALAFTAFFLLIDFAFWGANIVKISTGGWFPLVIGAVVFTLMTT